MERTDLVRQQRKSQQPQQVMQMMKMGIADPLPMITHRFALEDMREAVDVFTQRRMDALRL
ncbi:MAG: hypothetical protein ACLTW9_00650 [Enterocloster sp.]